MGSIIDDTGDNVLSSVNAVLIGFVLIKAEGSLNLFMMGITDDG
jgi:hypothetical protein